MVPARVKEKDPLVLLLEFGNSSVDFEVSIWAEDPWAARVTRSTLNMAIWDALKEAGITIAFPQVDVHFDEGAVPPFRGGTGGRRDERAAAGRAREEENNPEQDRPSEEDDG
jgi:small-conductance mechanosensitive channel